MPEFFPVEVRHTGVAFGHSTGAVIGGLTPYLATCFIAETGNTYIPGFMMVLAGVTGFLVITVAARKLPRHRLPPLPVESEPIAMTAIYVSDPVHPDVLAEPRRNSARSTSDTDRQAVRYDDVRDHVDAVMLRTETFTAEMIAGVTAAENHCPPRSRHRQRRHPRGHRRTACGSPSPPGRTARPSPNTSSPSPSRWPGRSSPPPHATRAGSWSSAKADLVGSELHGKTLGLYGLGSIGTRVATIANGFGMDIIVTDPYLTARAGRPGRRPQGRPRRAPHHRRRHQPAHPAHPGDPAHHRRRGASPQMRPGALLINTARGGLIDEAGADRRPALRPAGRRRRWTSSTPRTST